ncbi:hypothetical protein [Neisseria subflava]|jgi:hypothetical protein|uniref:hypothetical protein n=1 Tax=Neisseria subflava TaxID=28449 RepID=UPI00280BA1CC|nr:hypothetical protein [Neisseria subflava]
MKKSSIILISSFFLTACDLGFPRMYVNYDHLPKGEIKEYIVGTFPNDPEKEELGKIISAHLNGDNSTGNIKNIVSKMGMICQTGEEFCKYSGYIKTRVEGLSSGSGRAKHIYHIVVDPEKGLDSLKVEKQIVEDTEKGN